MPWINMSDCPTVNLKIIKMECLSKVNFFLLSTIAIDNAELLEIFIKSLYLRLVIYYVL